MKDPLAGLRSASRPRARKRYGSRSALHVLSRRVRRLGNGGPRRPWSQFYEVAVRVALGLAIATALTFTVAGRLPWQTVAIEEGELAPADVHAPRPGRFVNLAATERLQEDAVEGVPNVYQADLDARPETLQTLAATFAGLKAGRLNNPGDLADRLDRLQAELPITLSPEALTVSLAVEDPATLDELHDQLRALIEDTFDRSTLRSDTDDLEKQQQRLAERCGKLPFSSPIRALARELIRRVLTHPNLIYDGTATMKEREKAKLAVTPVVEWIHEGELILRKGVPVTAPDLRRLEAVGLYTHRSSTREVIAAFVLVACLLAVLAAFTRRYTPEVWGQLRLWALVGLLLVLGASIHKAGLHLGWPPYVAVPVVATVGMLLGILLEVQLAVIASGVLAVLVGVMWNGQVWAAAMAWPSALVGIHGVSELQSRSQLVRTGVILSAVNAVLAAAVGTLAQHPPALLIQEAGYGVAAGIGCAILTLGGAMFLERPFRLTTDLRLLELSNPNEPVLRRLLMEAPGTYHASIIIANLAETAAEAVGADSLLVRVGCYYHDIGKVKRPYLFVENQFGTDNPHDTMSPSLSVLAIQAHVKDGLEIGRRLRLPEPVLDVIGQHHGTTLVSFFYRQALMNKTDEDAPEESSYRYPGPKPQTRETAIVMLADGVEAAVRALPNPTPNAVEERVRQIITSRLDDGQLNECDLTLSDLETIQRSFARIMTGILHKRIEYLPTQLKALPGRTQKAANGAKRPPRQSHAATG